MYRALCGAWLLVCALTIILLSLTGCLVSDRPLITDANAVTPLPAQFDFAVKLNGQGILPPSKDTPSALPMHLYGKTYIAQPDADREGGTSLVFADLDKSSSTYVMQVHLPLGKSASAAPNPSVVMYFVAKPEPSGLELFTFPDKNSTAFLPEGVSFNDVTNDLEVSDFPHLIGAAQAYKRKGLLSIWGTLLIATTPTEIRQMESDTDAASPKPPQAPAPQATQAPAPSPTPAPSPPPTAAPSTEPTQGGVDGKTFLTWTVGVQRLYLNGAAQAYWAFQDTSRFPIHGECAEGEIRRFRHTFDSPMMSYLTNKFASEPGLDVVQSVYDYLGARCEPVGIDFLGGPYVFTDADLLDRLTNDNYFNEGLTQDNAADFLRAMVEMTSLVYTNSSYPSLAACTSNFLSEFEFSDLLDYVGNSDRDQGENVVQILQDVIAQSCHEQRKHH